MSMEEARRETASKSMHSEDEEMRLKAEEVSKLESKLRSEHRIKKELTTEITKLDNKVAELHMEVERHVDDGCRKDDWVQRLERLVHELHNQQEQVEAQHSSQLQEKDNKIRELIQAVEGQKTTLHRALADHSNAGINLSQMLERERREWDIERETLQSELYGHQQLIHECDMMKESNDRVRELEIQLEELKAANAELKAANTELQNRETEFHRSAYEKEIAANMEEISELKMRMSKVNDRIEDNFKRTEAEMEALRTQLRETIEERDKLVIELHGMKETALHSRSVRGSSISSVGSEVERCVALEGKIDEMRFELEEERAIAHATQENLEEQLRNNRQLEIEINQLRLNIQTPSRMERQTVHLGLDFLDYVHRLVMQLQDTLHSAQSQVAGIMTQRRSSQKAYHASSLNISLEEARHQIESIRTTVESSFGDRGASSSADPSIRRSQPSMDRRHRVFTVGRWSLGRLGSKHKNSREQMKEELEEMRRELTTLSHEKFSLEQCVRYLSSRCQMYQTAWKSQEQRQHRRVASQSGRRGASSSSGEIQMAEEDVQPEITSGSCSSRAANDVSPRLSRNVELRIIHKIASICEPFATQLSESSAARTLGRHRALREVPSFAS